MSTFDLPHHFIVLISLKLVTCRLLIFSLLRRLLLLLLFVLRPRTCFSNHFSSLLPSILPTLVVQAACPNIPCCQLATLSQTSQRISPLFI